MIRALFFILLMLVPMVPAVADTNARPLAVLRVEQALGQTIKDHRVAVTGAVYALAAPDGNASAQLAFDAQGRAVLARLVRSVAEPGATNGITTAAVTVAELFGITVTVLEDALATEALTILEASPDGDRSRPLPEGATLSYLSGPNVLVVDFPLSVPASERLGPDAVEALISDASLVVQEEDGSLFRYHAPDRRFAEGAEIGVTTGTGSWRVDDSGAYCLERAPISGFFCHAIHATGDRYHAVPLDEDGAPRAASLFEVVAMPGNPGSHGVARRADSTPPQVTRMLTRGRSEERRLPEGGRTRVHMASDGTYRGETRDGEPVTGTWSVLADGRRCLASGDTIECVFLSETDGGTYRLFDADGTLVGEALLSDGNPFGF